MLEIKSIYLKDIAFKKNAIKWQCLRYDGDYSIVFARYSTSEFKKGPSENSQGDVGKTFQASITDFGQNPLAHYAALNVFWHSVK